MRKNHFFIILTIALTFTLLQTPIATATTFQSEESDWWSSDWKYRRRVDITENSGYSITDFPVEVTFEHQGKAQPDGDDIRVIVDNVEIPSDISDLSSTHAKVIFQVSVDDSATKTIHVYYGNPDATKPNYQLVPLMIVEGTPGNAIIDNSVYLGWDNKIWGSDTRHLCIPWTDYKIDFDGNGDLTNNDDLIPDYNGWGSGIGRHRLSDIGSIGLGTYQGYTQTPIYVDINFQNAKLRVYRHHTWVETTQADYLLMFSPSYDHAKYGGGLEQNIVDGEGTNPRGWTGLYNSPTNPGWMALRDSTSGNVFAAAGLRIGQDYCYTFGAKEMSAWDRFITFDTCIGEYPLAPHDQPSDARIYWYGDNTNSYSNIETTANILNNQPSIIIGSEESYSNEQTDSAVQLTTHPAEDYGPDWSPDGTRLLFTSNRLGWDAGQGPWYHYDIWVMDQDGANQRPVTNSPYRDCEPSWSPDSTQAVFCRTDQSWTSTDDDIWIVDVEIGETSAHEIFTYGDDQDPDWSPDGTKIAFNGARGWEIFAITPLGTELIQVTDFPGTSPVDWPDWSPDGSKIAFVYYVDWNPDLPSIWVVDSDKTYAGMDEATMLTDNGDHPAWSPDGKKIAFSSERSGNWDIWVMNADGTNPVQITTDPANDRRPTWSPDGTKIAFQSHRAGNWDIWVISLVIPEIDIDQAYVSDDRVDVGSVQTIRFHAKWVRNNSDVVRGSIYVNGVEYVTDGNGWITFNDSLSMVGRKSWVVTGVNCGGVTTYSQTAPTPTIIWDRVAVTLSAEDKRINVGSNAAINYHAIYEYDRDPFSGSIILNDLFFSQDEVGKREYKAVGIVDNRYQLTAFTTNEIYVIWDQVNVKLSVLNPRIGVGSTANITWTGTYEYDEAAFLGSVSYNDSLTNNAVGRYGYTVASITDPSYGLTSFTANEVYCIFDRIRAETKVETLTPGSVQVTLGLNFEYDGLPVEDAIVRVNDIVAENIGNGKYRVTLSSWMPSLAINIEAERAGFEPITMETSSYALGNIILGGSLITILSIVAVLKSHGRRVRRKKWLMNLRQLEELVVKKGRLEIREASEAVDVDIADVKALFSELIKEGRIKGSFTLDGKGFVTEEKLKEEIMRA